MHEISCASCTASFEYNHEDYIHLCPFCSAGFVIDSEDGSKDLIGDHYIVPTNVLSENIPEIFNNWIKERYHKPEKIPSEFRILGFYGVMMPYWVISLEAHTYWCGHSSKEKHYPGQSSERGAKFVREDGRFSRRYRWASIARKSPKEHWGIERLHVPKESISVDWDGFPFDESLGLPDDGNKAIYEAKLPFKFDLASALTVVGIQVKEGHALMRVKDQVTEYHRRIAKTKIGSLFEHRTEIEIVGIHVVHIPFWFVRYAYLPKSSLKLLQKTTEKRIVIQGYTKAVLEAELPLISTDKVIVNLVVCSFLAFTSLSLSLFVSPYFYILFISFLMVVFFSGMKIKNKSKMDLDFIKGKADLESVS